MGRTVASGLVSLTLGHLEQAVWVVDPWPWISCCVLAKARHFLQSKQFRHSSHEWINKFIIANLISVIISIICSSDE